MTVVITDDLTSYADSAAMTAVGWDLVNVAHGATLTGGPSGFTVSIPGGVSFYSGHRGERVYSGLTPSAYYTVSAVVSTCTLGAGVYDIGLVASRGGSFGQVEDYLGHSNQTSVTLTADQVRANTDGTLQVKLGSFSSLQNGSHPDWSVTYITVTIDDGAAAPVFSSSLPIRGEQWDQIAYTAGVVRIGDTVFGLTRGALRFDPGETWEPLPYDGDFIAPVGVHELTSQKPRFIGAFLPVGERHLARYLPKSTQATSADTTVVTPAVPGSVLVQADYTLDFSVTWPYLSGGTITVTFPYAFWQRYEFNPADKNEMLIPCEILAVPLTAAAAPYTVTVVEPGTIS